MIKKKKQFALLFSGATLAALSLTAPALGAVAEPSSFTPPTAMLAPTMTGDSPAQMWMYPSNPSQVVRELLSWFAAARSLTVRQPKPLRGLAFEDYMGPAQLYFTDQNGQQVTVAPVFYIAHGAKGYHPVYVANDLTYKVGDRTQEIWSPALFSWMTHASEWQGAFRAEAWTNAEKAAIHDAKASRWGGAWANRFPGIPGIVAKRLGDQSAVGRGAGPYATFATLVNRQGEDEQVAFVEVSTTGESGKTWTYLVSPRGAVLSHTTSGV